MKNTNRSGYSKYPSFHNGLLNDISLRQQKVDRDFQKTRAMVMDIYRNWSINFFRHNDVRMPLPANTLRLMKRTSRILSLAVRESRLGCCNGSTRKVQLKPRAMAHPARVLRVVQKAGVRAKAACPASGRLRPQMAKVHQNIKAKSIIPTLCVPTVNSIHSSHRTLRFLIGYGFTFSSRISLRVPDQCYSQKTYQKLKDRGFEFKPEFVRDDLCRECVVAEFPGMSSCR